MFVYCLGACVFVSLLHYCAYVIIVVFVLCLIVLNYLCVCVVCGPARGSSRRSPSGSA